MDYKISFFKNKIDKMDKESSDIYNKFASVYEKDPAVTRFL